MGLLQHRMIGMQGRTDGEPFIACSSLNVGLAKRSRVEQFAVCDAVQSAATSHRKIINRHACVQTIQKMEEDLLKALLHRIRQIHIALRDFRMWLARLPKK